MNFAPLNGTAINGPAGVSTTFAQTTVGAGTYGLPSGSLFSGFSGTLLFDQQGQFGDGTYVERPDDNQYLFFAVTIITPVEIEVLVRGGDIKLWVDIEVEVTNPVLETGDISIPVFMDVTGEDDLSAGVDIRVFDPSLYFDFTTRNAFRWGAVVTLETVGGDRPGESGDISEFLTGTISVEAEESTARVADFTREPRPIGPCPTETDPEFLDITKHVGRSVTIDYVLKDTDGSVLDTQRVFTGLVDNVTYDPVTRLSGYTCTDNRQVLLENMDRTAIDGLMPGSYYSDFVFDPDADNFEYASDRLSTIPFTLDLDRFGAWQYTPFRAQASGAWSFGEANTIYETLGIEIENYRNITTQVDIEIPYSFKRLRERLGTFGWSYPGSFCNYLNSGHTLPRKDMIVQAANGGSWTLDSVTFENMPPSSNYQCAQLGGGINMDQIWVNDGSGNAPFFALAASGTITKRFRNTVRENYLLTIKAPEAEARFGGVIKDSFTVSVDAQFDENDWASDKVTVEEAYIERNPRIKFTVQRAGDGLGGAGFDLSPENNFGYDFSVQGTDRYYDLTGYEIPSGEGRREDLDNAINTAIQKGKVMLLESHRQNRVTWQSLLMPELELYQTLEIDTCPVHARGKVFSIVHEMDMSSGAATTQVTVSVSKTTDGAVVETPTAPPPPPDTVSGMGSGGGFFGLGTRYGGQNANTFFEYAYPGAVSPEIDDDPFNGYTGNRIPNDIGSQVYPTQFQIITEAIDEGDEEDIEEEKLAEYDVGIPDELLDLQA